MRPTKPLSKLSSYLQHKHLQYLAAARVDGLIAEITQPEKVRDSTLRRSTGYALGFLSIMRSEIACRKPPRQLCRKVIQSLLSRAMPPKDWLGRFLDAIYGNSSLKQQQWLWYIDGKVDESFSEHHMPVEDGQCSVRSRVHALNALRMIVSDAPMSQEVQPFIGDAIAVAIVGYLDPDWGFGIRPPWFSRLACCE